MPPVVAPTSTAVDLEETVNSFYDGEAGSLFVEAYDAFYSRPPPQIANGVAFYEGLARQTGGPVLEVACGTGRIAFSCRSPCLPCA